MIKFGTPTIALPLAIKKCTVQTGCTVYIRTDPITLPCSLARAGNKHKEQVIVCAFGRCGFQFWPLSFMLHPFMNAGVIFSSNKQEFESL